ncbi:uncharacterized protein LOC100904598 [Galendromus occidentalis]|uniref:Uncharacterized protein LOC100904598 n=1 Tax=Galendromus occidentalis TaxID=34638 RepID=A0AAJ6QLM4_9ACAR|nr:uncharacterized protein LOC100904598 [Galendromus occidentalis]
MPNESNQYPQYIPKMTSSSAGANVRAARDDRIYNATSQAAAMAASAAASAAAAGLPSQQIHQMPSAVHQYQYNPLHAPVSGVPSQAARRMLAPQSIAPNSHDGYPLYRRQV